MENAYRSAAWRWLRHISTHSQRDCVDQTPRVTPAEERCAPLRRLANQAIKHSGRISPLPNPPTEPTVRMSLVKDPRSERTGLIAHVKPHNQRIASTPPSRSGRTGLYTLSLPIAKMKADGSGAKCDRASRG